MSTDKNKQCIHFSLEADENDTELPCCNHVLSIIGNCQPNACPRANGYTEEIVGE